ncbi:MAG: type II secretion system GspH family protein [Lachnospiraceae bacterium]|nr:type II secretion system GspH family protein [Lachnospiraceae bacterium]
MSKRKDNRGMTLVEVIIAITILGLVAVPVLQSLTTSMVYNSKARVRQELTLTAESIMESFKGYGVSGKAGMAGKFNAGTGLDGLLSGDALNGASYSCTYTSSTDGVTDADITTVSADYLDLIASDAVYTFTVAGLTSNSQTYDVEITATPGSKLDVYVPEDAEATRDAVFKGDKEWDTKALENAKTDFAETNKSSNASALAAHFDGVKTGLEDSSTAVEIFVTDGTDEYDITDSSIVENVVFDSDGNFYIGNYVSLCERNIDFNVKYDGSSYIVTAEVEFGYEVSGYPYVVRETTKTYDKYTGDYTKNINESTKTLNNTAMGGTMYYTVDISTEYPGGEVYSNTASGLDRLYVYYYPEYSLTDNMTITVDSSLSGSMDDFECYIIKQRAANLTDAQTTTKESGYSPNVSVSNVSTANVVVFHNLDINIGDSSATTSASAIPTISGTNGGVYSLDTSTGLGFMYAGNGLTDNETLSYAVTLTVTRQSTGGSVTSMESTVIEGID